MITTVRVGEQFPDLSHNGDVLPLGSVVGNSQNRRDNGRFIQRSPRTWVSGHAPGLIGSSRLNSPLYLYELPDAEEVELAPETASQFRWRLRDTALAAADRSNVPRDPVNELATRFGAPDARLTVGGVISNSWDIARLPVGTVLYSGHPDQPDYLNVWTMVERMAGATGPKLRHTFGPASEREPGQPMTIFSLPSLPEPALVEEPIADQLALAKIALSAWRLGRIYQKKNSWCSVFSDTLTSLGITEQALTLTGESAHGPGDIVNREQASLLAEGSLLWWGWRSGARFAVYQRDNGAKNKARTRLIFSSESDRDQSHDHMTVISTPTEPMVWRLSGSWLARLPDGVTYLEGSTEKTLTPDTKAHLLYWMQYEVKGWPDTARVVVP